VKPRPRKTERGLIPKIIYEEAARKVIDNEQAVRKVAKDYGMCHVSLNRFVNALRNNLEPKVGYNPYNRVFTPEQESQLVKYCEKTVDLYFGLTTKDLRKLAFQFASANRLNYPQKWNEVEQASEDWLAAFLRRNPHLTLRTPQATSLARAMNFNRENVSNFFNKLSTVLERHSFEPQNIYNIDETGVSTVQKPTKVIAKKGTKQVGSIASQERGTLVTLCVAVNAVGNAIPPMFIFPRLHFKDHFIRDGPIGCIGGGNKSGWMQENEFLDFMKHFVKHVKPSETNKVLILLDNHCSHVSISLIDYCRANFITLLSFPPHTSHRLQPLDRGVYGPFKKYFNNSADQWMKNNPGKRMTIYDLPSIVKASLPLATTPSNILAGFSCTGIWPFNREIFQDCDYLPSTVTDKPLDNEHPVIETNLSNIECETEEHKNQTKLPKGKPAHLNESQPGPSTARDTTPSPQPGPSTVRDTFPSPQSQPTAFITPDILKPLPKADHSKSRKGGRMKRKTAILTDTPEKMLIEEQNLNKKVPVKLKIGQDDTKKSGVKVDKIRSKRIKTVKKKPVENFSSDSSDDETFCLVCRGPYSASKEDWLQCRTCKEWAHLNCTDKNPFYVCINCNSDDE